MVVERIVVVSQYCGEALSKFIGRNIFNIQDKVLIAYQILKGLEDLHRRSIVHRNLCLENVLMQYNLELKLFDYGMYYMTDRGNLVSFPIT